MCGLAGWIGPLEAGEETLHRMCDALVHRGPDEAGQHLEDGVALGFRRLSIIDLDTGSQPLFSESGHVAAICNGEIYNFRELRAGLERRGHRFRSRSDCETIVHLYEEHGVDFVHQLQGMFAIALWDRAARRLLLVRDRLGVKPLYWTRLADRSVMFGSEPGALLASGLIDATPDPAAIMQYLTLQYVPAPLSGFEGIRKLRPGERLIIEDGEVALDRYWTLDGDAAAPRGRDQVMHELDDLFSVATRERLIADVPLGAFLSGGIDSSLVVGYMADAASTVNTFSIDFPEVGYSEAAHARTVARLYGTNHEELLVEAEMVPVVAEAVRQCGEPFADSSAIPTYLLCQLARQHVTVALSGDGGDEAYGGYWRYQRMLRADRLGAAGRMAAKAARRLVPGARLRAGSRLATAVDVLASTPHERNASLLAHFEPGDLRRLCRPEFVETAGGTREAWERVLALPAGRDVNRYMALDVATYLPEDLLTKVDRMSMAHALEVRSPLLDYRVQELAARVPGHLKLDARTTKRLLRDLASRRGLPAEIVDRPKKGFSVPISAWFRGRLRSWVEDVLLDPATCQRGYFHEQEVARLVSEHIQCTADHSSKLWNLAMLELWHRAWIDPPVGVGARSRQEPTFRSST